MIKKSMLSNLDIQCLANGVQKRQKYAMMENSRHSENMCMLAIANTQMAIWEGLKNGQRALKCCDIKTMLVVWHYLKGMVKNGGFIDAVKRRGIQ